MWITSSLGYVNFEFLKITAPIVFNQLKRFEPGNLGSESKCSSTAPSWDLYVESWDNVDFQLLTTGTSQRPPIDPMQAYVA